MDGRTASLRSACSDGAAHATCIVQHQLLDSTVSEGLPNATKMEGLSTGRPKTLKPAAASRRRRPSAPRAGRASSMRPRAGTDAGYGARDWLEDCRALRRRRDAADAAREAENNAIADGHVCATTMRRWRRRARGRRDLAPRAVADRRAQRLDEVARGGSRPRAAPGPRTARSIITEEEVRRRAALREVDSTDAEMQGGVAVVGRAPQNRAPQDEAGAALLAKPARGPATERAFAWQCMPEVAEPRRPRAGLEPLAAFYRDGQSHEAALATKLAQGFSTVVASQ